MWRSVSLGGGGVSVRACEEHRPHKALFCGVYSGRPASYRRVLSGPWPGSLISLPGAPPRLPSGTQTPHMPRRGDAQALAGG